MNRFPAMLSMLKKTAISLRVMNRRVTRTFVKLYLAKRLHLIKLFWQANYKMCTYITFLYTNITLQLLAHYFFRDTQTKSHTRLIIFAFIKRGKNGVFFAAVNADAVIYIVNF